GGNLSRSWGSKRDGCARNERVRTVGNGTANSATACLAITAGNTESRNQKYCHQVSEVVAQCNHSLQHVGRVHSFLPLFFRPVSRVNPVGGAFHDAEMAAMNSTQDANLVTFTSGILVRLARLA